MGANGMTFTTFDITYYLTGSAIFHCPLSKLVLLGISESIDRLKMFQAFFYV